MFLGAGGIVINEAGELLVIQRDDTRTWTYPGGALDMGELPTDAVVREVEEETGIKVYPVRLVGIFFNPVPARGDLLVFSFRCIQRGGEIKTSAEKAGGRARRLEDFEFEGEGVASEEQPQIAAVKPISIERG